MTRCALLVPCCVAVLAVLLSGSVHGGDPPIASWERLWTESPGAWALADRTAVAADGSVYVTARPQAGGGNGSAILKYGADGVLLWTVLREEVIDGSEGFTDIEITAEGVSAVGTARSEEGASQTLLVNYDADGGLLWEARTVGPRIAGFLAPQLAIGPNGERVIATDDGAGVGALERYAADGALLGAVPLTFSGFGGVSSLAVDGAGNALVTTLEDFTVFAVQKYAPDGTLAWTHTEAAAGLALSEAPLVLAPNGDIVVTGSLEVFEVGGPDVVARVWRLTPDGALVWRVDTTTDFAIGNDLAVGPDGATYLLVNLGASGSQLRRFDADGTEAWTRSFSGPDFVTNFTHVTLGAFGDVFVAGRDATGFEFSASRVLRYSAAGDLVWTERVAEMAGHTTFVGDLGAGADGSVAVVGTDRAENSFDRAFTVRLDFPECSGDLDGNGAVGFSDLLALLAAWGPQAEDVAADLDDDGAVGFGDLVLLLSAWGECG